MATSDTEGDYRQYVGGEWVAASEGETIAVSAAGNVVGGIGLVTFAHVAQVRGADGRDD